MLGCMQDDIYEKATKDQNHSENTLKGKILVLNQSELQERYIHNIALNTIFENEFKIGQSLFKTSNQSGPYVDIDLDHIQVYESETAHTITYRVNIGDASGNTIVYNLMYSSGDYQNYYVSLLKYDLTTLNEFRQNPTLNVVSLIPLNEIENIYDNIQYSISATANEEYPSLYTEFLNLSDCLKEVTYPAQSCKKCGREWGDTDCKNSDASTRAKGPITVLDFSACGDRGGSSGGDGSSGPPPGAPNPPPGGSLPVKTTPIKLPVDFVKVGDLIFDPNLGNQDINKATLKKLVASNKVILQTLLNNSTDTREHGYAFSKQKINNEYTPKANLTEIDVNAASNWSLNINPIITISNYTGIIHTHTNPNAQVLLNGSYIKAPPMFSHSDILALFLLSKENTSIKKQLAESFFGLLTPTSLYVIMFPNDATLDNFGTKYGKAFLTIKKDKKMWGEINQFLEKEYGKIVSSTDTDQVKAKKYEKALLTILKKNNLPINLYKLDANNGQFDGTWKLLDLDSTGNITENNGL